jgi:type I restriction enzyme S subunit
MAKAEWKPRRLDELGFVGRGKSRHRPRNQASLYGGPYPFIQTADVMAADPYITTYSQTYSEFGFQQSKMWPPGTLCMTIAGANTAKTAILKIESCFPDSMVGFIPDKSKSDLHFVKYSLDLMRHRFLSVSRGATQDNLSLDKLLSFPISAPSVDEQRRIGAILSAYDELMENSQRRIRLLEAMARALYREWFVRFRIPAEVLTKAGASPKIKLVASPIGDIPQGWEVMTVAESFEISGGGTPSRKESSYWDCGTIQWFAPSDLTAVNTMFMDDSPEHITELGLAESSARLFRAFSVMLTSRATIGAIAINTHEACTNQGFITCLPNERVPLFFLFHWLTENVQQFERLASGATFKEISRGVFKTIEFLHPSAALVRRFESQVEPMAKQMLALQRQIQNLRRTRDLLLPRLLSGQVNLGEN